MYDPKMFYVAQDVGDLLDQLATMLGSAPTFKSRTGLFPDQTIDTEFFTLGEGLKAVRSEVGEETYANLVDLAARMRAHFEADPEEKTGESSKGYECLHEMDDILTEILRSQKH